MAEELKEGTEIVATLHSVEENNHENILIFGIEKIVRIPKNALKKDLKKLVG